MKHRLIATFAFNLIDIIATLVTTQSGFVEVNPVAAFLLNEPNVFLFVKFTLVTALLLYLWANRQNRLARVASWIAFGMYGALAVYYTIVFCVYCC